MAIAVIFPGQGSQSVGMFADLREQEARINERIAEASAVIDEDLGSLIESGPSEQLNQTAITQPALLTLSFALYECWIARGGTRPVALAGHSLGEYAALTAAGAINFADAVKLVHERGRLMQEAVPAGVGAMAAVLGLEDDQVAEICASVEGVVSPANMNSPGQVVIAGAKDAVATASSLLDEAGARRIVPLDVSVPSHCELMNPAADGLAILLESIELATPGIPVYNNVDAVASSDPDEIRGKLIRQLSSPVKWSTTITAMIGADCDVFLECGPGKVLTGLMRRIDRSATATSIGSSESLATALGA